MLRDRIYQILNNESGLEGTVDPRAKIERLLSLAYDRINGNPSFVDWLNEDPQRDPNNWVAEDIYDDGWIKQSIKVDPKNPDKFSTFLTDRIKKNPDLVKELYRNGVANTIFENCERMLDEGNMKSVEEYNIFKGLRWFDAFQNFCICHDIPFMHAGAFYPIESYYEDLITSKRIESFFMHPLYDYIKEENFVGWPIFTRLGGFTMSSQLDWKDPERTLLRIGHTRSSDLGGQGDMHPNEAGHELISEVFYEHYKKLR